MAQSERSMVLVPPVHHSRSNLTSKLETGLPAGIHPPLSHLSQQCRKHTQEDQAESCFSHPTPCCCHLLLGAVPFAPSPCEQPCCSCHSSSLRLLQSLSVIPSLPHLAARCTHSQVMTWGGILTASWGLGQMRPSSWGPDSLLCRHPQEEGQWQGLSSPL